MIFANPVEGTILPLGSNPPRGRVVFRVTQDFGPTSVTAEPDRYWTGGEGIPPGYYPNFHDAIDLGNKGCGAKVLAAAPGKVIQSDKDPYGANRIVLGHGEGYETRYVHLADRDVSKGQSVKAGGVIGHVGDTGNSSACHLHFAVTLNGKPVDPWRRLAQNVEDPMIPITDDTPKSVTTSPGAVYYDPATNAKVSEAVATNTRTSAYASKAYRLVTITRSTGETQLVGVKPTDPKVKVTPLAAPKLLAPGVYEVA